MWWSKIRSGISSVFLRSSIAGLALALAGCSIQPLYLTQGQGGLESQMRAIQIEPIPNRLGHYIAQDLNFRFNGSGAPTPPKYRLTVSFREKVYSPVIDTVTARATSASIVADAEFSLTPIEGGLPIVSGVAFGAASYDRFNQRLGNVRAAHDAEIRNAKAITDQIVEQITAKFAKGG